MDGENYLSFHPKLNINNIMDNTINPKNLTLKVNRPSHTENSFHINNILFIGQKNKNNNDCLYGFNVKTNKIIFHRETDFKYFFITKDEESFYFGIVEQDTYKIYQVLDDKVKIIYSFKNFPYKHLINLNIEGKFAFVSRCSDNKQENMIILFNNKHSFSQKYIPLIYFPFEKEINNKSNQYITKDNEHIILISDFFVRKVNVNTLKINKFFVHGFNKTVQNYNDFVHLYMKINNTKSTVSRTTIKNLQLWEGL